MNTDYQWQQFYLDAVLETDDAQLQERVEVAQAAIEARLIELSRNSLDGHEERIAISDALNGLRMLRNERLQR